MAKLVVTTDQEGVITAVEPDLEAAFAFGVEDTSHNLILDSMPLYSDPTVQTQKQGVKDPFKALLAAMMVAFNIKRALPVGITATVTLAQLTTLGTPGSLTFVDGILTAKVDPT